jgi:hypothetical protein
MNFYVVYSTRLYNTMGIAIICVFVMNIADAAADNAQNGVGSVNQTQQQPATPLSPLEQKNQDEIAHVNDFFNQQVDNLDAKQAKKTDLLLGAPSLDLLSTGVFAGKVIALNGAKLQKIAQRLGVPIQALKNLPQALQNPLAVYRTDPANKNMASVLTEMRIQDKNVVVVINVAGNGDVDVSVVSDITLSPSDFIAQMIDEGRMIWVNKKKFAPSSVSASAPKSTESLQPRDKPSPQRYDNISNFQNPVVDNDTLTHAMLSSRTAREKWEKEYARQVEQRKKRAAQAKKNFGGSTVLERQMDKLTAAKNKIGYKNTLEEAIAEHIVKGKKFLWLQPNKAAGNYGGLGDVLARHISRHLSQKEQAAELNRLKNKSKALIDEENGSPITALGLDLDAQYSGRNEDGSVYEVEDADAADTTVQMLVDGITSKTKAMRFLEQQFDARRREEELKSNTEESMQREYEAYAEHFGGQTEATTPARTDNSDKSDNSDKFANYTGRSIYEMIGLPDSALTK